MSRDVASKSSQDSGSGRTADAHELRWSERHPIARRHSANTRHRKLRVVYFALAAIWGFAAGSVAVLAGLNAVGHPIRLDAGLGLTMAVAAVVAIVGGVVTSLAYREAVRRRG